MKLKKQNKKVSKNAFFLATVCYNYSVDRLGRISKDYLTIYKHEKVTHVRMIYIKIYEFSLIYFCDCVYVSMKEKPIN